VLVDQVEEHGRDVHGRKHQDEVRIELVEIGQKAPRLRAHETVERALGHDVVACEEAGRGLDERCGQHRGHGPPAERVVRQVVGAVGPEQRLHVGLDPARPDQEGLEARGRAAGKAPGHAEEDQAQDREPAPGVQLHGVAADFDRDVRDGHETDQQPVEQACRQVPDHDRPRFGRLAHVGTSFHRVRLNMARELVRPQPFSARTLRETPSPPP
jgi:hypothetical protein